jgi:hypothetical protein
VVVPVPVGAGGVVVPGGDAVGGVVGSGVPGGSSEGDEHAAARTRRPRASDVLVSKVVPIRAVGKVTVTQA